MAQTELSHAELALESVELLPDRETMQLTLAFGNAAAFNGADVTQSNSADVTTGNASTVDISQGNASTLAQAATATGGNTSFSIEL